MYAIQERGNGHLSRAERIIPYLRKKGKKKRGGRFGGFIGERNSIGYPFAIMKESMLFKGMSFISGRRRNRTCEHHMKKPCHPVLLMKLKSLQLNSDDIIINDFEPIFCLGGSL